METTAEVTCPKCGGRVWDNRETKRSPTAPDYKCRDRSCDGVIWPPRKGTAPAKPTPFQRALNTPKALPSEFEGYEDEETAELHAHTGNGASTAPSKGTLVARQYESTLDWVLSHVVPKLSAADIPVDGAAVNAICATIIIQASRAA